MSKKCGKCSKTVYPTEELKCLDKVWHKACFKCQVCNMTLNMKNYKGYDKLPYCNAHYPQTKHTAVADTPESRRIAENTKIQSNVQYHSEFERFKSSYTVIPDNPELQRHMLNTKNASLNLYHADFERTKGDYTTVVDPLHVKKCLENTRNLSSTRYHADFERTKSDYTTVVDPLVMKKCLENTKNLSANVYHADFEKTKGNYTTVVDPMSVRKCLENTKNLSTTQYKKDFQESKGKVKSIADPLTLKTAMAATKNASLVRYHSDFEKEKSHYTVVADPLEMQRHKDNQKNISGVEYHKDFEHTKSQYTTVADSADMKRHQSNQKILSAVEYHSEFEKGKMSVNMPADALDFKRSMTNQKLASEIKYHENFEKEKGKKMSVADDPETQRLKKNMQVVSNVAYHNTLQEKARMEQNRPNEETDNFAARRRGHKNPGSITDYVPTAVATPPQNQPTHVYNSKGEEEAEVFDDEKQNHQSRRQIGSIADYDPIPNQILAAQPTGYQSVPSQQPRSPAMFAPTPYSPPGQFSSVQRQIGSVNFNPMPNSSPAPSSQYTSQPQARPGQGSMYTPFRPVQVVEDTPDVKEEEPVPEPYSDQTQEEPQAPEVVGGGFRTTYPTDIPSSPQGSPEDTRVSSQSIPYTPQSHEADISGGGFQTTYSVDTPDLVEEDNTSRGFSPTVGLSSSSPPPVEEPSAVGAGFRTTYQVDEEAPQPAKQNKGIVSQALYDYAAADTDEVSFMENDVIINCEPVDDGWMYGTVERTNKRGMLPSNYVQRLN
ncbi:nebulin-like [Haliotis rufescens]|uniref:nebulin-like n=1 Tax=Haliotis rufescens TaxID=6454 RepID=UPI001EB09D0D|nr:nebulin-like [Haliotis rufescens]